MSVGIHIPTHTCILHTDCDRPSCSTGFLVQALSVLVHDLSAEQHRGLSDLLCSRMEGRKDKACCGRTGWWLIVGAPVKKPAFINPLRFRFAKHPWERKLNRQNSGVSCSFRNLISCLLYQKQTKFAFDLWGDFEHVWRFCTQICHSELVFCHQPLMIRCITFFCDQTTS